MRTIAHVLNMPLFKQTQNVSAHLQQPREQYIKQGGPISIRGYGQIVSTALVAIAFGSKDYTGITQNHN